MSVGMAKDIMQVEILLLVTPLGLRKGQGSDTHWSFLNLFPQGPEHPAMDTHRHVGALSKPWVGTVSVSKCEHGLCPEGGCGPGMP